MDGIKDQIVKLLLANAISKNPKLFADMLTGSDGDMSVFVREFRREIMKQLSEESGRKKSE